MTKQDDIKKVKFIKNDQLPTEIICIVDRSGSMGLIANDAIGGFNEFLKQQKEQEGEANLTLVLFDNRYEMVYDRVNIQDVPELSSKTYVPRGSTALNDAIGITLQDFKERFSQEDRPSQIIVSILTDGEENASKEYNTQQAKGLIEEFQKDDYEFIFLASDDIEGKAMAFNYNIDAHKTFAFAKSGVGAMRGMADMSKVTTCYRAGVDLDQADLTQDVDSILAQHQESNNANLADNLADPTD